MSIGQRPTRYGGWHEPGEKVSGFVKDGSVIRMEYGGDGAGTIVIYVDGRRLGLLFSQADLVEFCKKKSIAYETPDDLKPLPEGRDV